MLPVRRASIVAVVVSALAMLPRTLAAQQSSLADVMVAAGFAVPLSTPITPVTTIETIRQVLNAAKVPFGIEGAAYREPTLVDLAHPRVELANLHAMSVGEALNTIARADPTVHWREQDGVIDVRMTAGPTWIDRNREPFSVTDADAGQALDALVSAADPSRRGHVAPLGLRPPLAKMSVMSFPADSPPPAPPRISVARDRGSMLEGLNALARAAHGSWRITYDGPAVEVDDATIVLFVAGASVEAPSPLAERLRADPNRIETTLGTDLDFAFAVLSYARRAHVTVGIETLPAPEFVPGSGDPQNLVLALDRREPRASLERLLAYDSRYALSEEHGVFHVGPAAGPVVPALSERLAGFSVSSESVESVLNRILHRRLMQPIGPQRPQTSVSAVSVSLTIADDATVRDALDALCDAASVSWAALVSADGAVELTIEGDPRVMMTTTSWRAPSVAGAAARPPGVVAVPQAVAALRDVLPVAMAPIETPFGAYLLDTAHTPGERRAAFFAQDQAPTFSTTSRSGPDVLTRLLGQLPGYRWSLESGVYHIQPAGPIGPDAVINRRVASFDVRVLNLPQLAGLLVDLIVGRQSVRLASAQAENTGPVHLAFPGGTARDALDAVSRTHDAPSWILTLTDNGWNHVVALLLCPPDGSRCVSASAPDR